MSLPHAELNTLYLQHHHWLLGWLRKRMGGEESARDLAQDTFLRLMNKQEAPDLRTPRAYLTCVAEGLLINFWRRRDIERAYLEHLATLSLPWCPPAEERQAALDALLRLDRMLGNLPARTREVFLLSRLDGLGYAEIAQRLGISVRTVKRDMAAAWLDCLQAME
ncbi:sigma-70 family RNA polymerase sigma factor [Solilutibacter pythonis]|uniref:sigma-70 family RNA polymerase sigma factor n=1 Tax=Solilutibacter pythonis TaxID=2483112 RepID=UPI001FEBEF87|nr:sigma-70 family RNA polymerase sigma factor [Lysobacter pythonis]